MTAGAQGKSETVSRTQLGRAILLLAVLLAVCKPLLPEFLVRPSEWLVFPFADWINWLFVFVKDDLGFIHVTRAFAAGIEWMLDVTANLLYGRNRWPRIGPIPWTFVAITAAAIGYALNGWRLALLSGGTFVWIAVMGQWKWSMETLSVIVVAAPVAIIVGLVLGVAAWRWPTVERIMNPILNIAQSLPHFAYMIPVVVFIGVGPKSGAVVTIIFAAPPMIRMTLLGLKKVASEITESGKMCGATGWQLLRHVRVPSARTEVLVGINQVIMQCLAMVVLASFIGMPGLGQKLLQLLQALKIGRSVEIGVSIVLIAIVLDRCSKAWVEKEPVHFEKGTAWHERYRTLVAWALLSALALVVAQFWQLADQIPRQQTLTIYKEIDTVVDLFIIVADPVTQGIRAFLITWVLIPMRDAYLWLPYSSVLALAAGIGWLAGGVRSSLTCAGFVMLIAMSGWWDRAMITTYMVSFAVLLVCAIGLPLGVWASKSAVRAKTILLFCDTAQTFPSFIYLIPVVMLFGVNDVAAIGAVVVFGLVPMTRYTIEGLRAVPPELVEAADMCGASSRQKLWAVSMPMALPTIAVGLNQTILFSLFMVIIAAFIGTQDLGQEMQRALSSTDVGKGLVLGLCVAFIGLLVDHLIVTWSARRKQALGLA